MEMMQYQLARLPYQDSLKALEADIHRANALYIKTGDQNHLLMEGRQPSGTSMRLHDSLDKLEISEEELSSIACSSSGNKIVEGDGRLVNVDLEREDECGICLEPCTKVVLPHCCHAMCIKCYGKWNTQSESCPFRLGILRRVNSEDL